MIPKISFVLPTRNRLEWIGESIQSLLSQTVPETELIIVNDASTDGTKEFLDSWARQFSKIKIIHNEQQMGGGLSRNVGMKEALAPIIGVCDDDDISPNERAELTLKHFELNPKSELVNFPYLSIGYFNERLEEFEGMPFDHDAFLTDGTVTYFSNPGSAHLKASAEEIGGYSAETDKETDDIQFLRKWVEAGKKVDFQPGYFLNYHRILQDSMMAKQRGWDPKWIEK